MRKPLLVTLTLAGLVLPALLSSAASAAPFVWKSAWTTNKADEVQRGGTLRRAQTSDPRTFNPFVTVESGSVPDIISGGSLFTLDVKSYEYLPYMAQSYTVSADKRTWTLAIRPGMKWSDGKPIVANDWYTTWKIHTDPKVSSNYYDGFQMEGKTVQAKVVNASTIQFIFPRVDATAIEILSFAPWPAHVFGPLYAKGGADAVRTAWRLNSDPKILVSFGAWRLSAFKPGERFEFVRNPRWGEWNKDEAGGSLPYLDGLRVSVVKDSNSALVSYLSDAIDIYAPRNADDLSQIKKAIDGGKINAEFRPRVSPAASSSFWEFNFNKASDPEKQRLFRDANFRRAMSHLVNRQAIIDIAYGEQAEPAYSSVFATFKDWVNPKISRFDFNPEAATKLLSGLGYAKKNGAGYLVNAKNRVLEFDLMFGANSSNDAKTGQIIRDEAKKVGVKINLRPLDINSVYEKQDEPGLDRKWDSSFLGLSGGSLLFPFSQNVLSCTGRLHDINRSGKCLFDWEQQLQELYTKGAREFDITKRKQIGYQIQAIQSSVQDVTYIVSPLAHFTWNKRVRGEYPKEIGNDTVGARAYELSWIAKN
jgi:peptide/nickel transport system substrate-binding protein